MENYRQDDDIAPVELEFDTKQYDVEPLSHWVWVLPDDTPETTAGGIFIPDGFRKLRRTGTVVGVGPGTSTADGLIPMRVKKGDKVFYGEYAGQKFRVGGTVYLQMRESELMCRLVEKGAGI